MVAYGRIIPPWMLALPRTATSICMARCCRSIAALLLSSGRSRTGRVVTGVTTMRIDEGLDTGDMLLARAVPIGPEETAADVFEPC